MPHAADASPDASLRRRWFAEAARDVQLTRALLASGLGFIYLVGFAILIEQGLPLLGEHGIMPLARFLERVRAGSQSGSEAFWAVPSLFWLSASDVVLQAASWVGAALGLAVVLGFGNAPAMFVLWALYGSFVHAGQTFYGYGWEMLLLEAGFLGIFLVPPWRPLRELCWPRRAPPAAGALRVPPLLVIWLFRWLTFRVMFGAGLIKLRGDSCWTDLTCLVYHYETQPNPHPLSWLLHQAPPWFHAIGVLLNHFVEVVVPFGVFGPRRLRHWAGGFTVAFQVILILSGNLSFLNWLTLVVALGCFDDTFWRRLIPAAWLRWARDDAAAPLGRVERIVCLVLVAAIALLSINPVANLLSPRQQMNAGFDPLHLVNTYGAFGSVSRERHEVVLEGASAPAGASEDALDWKEYEFPCKPGDPLRAPCLVTPYHYRLDWQMWFAGLSRADRQPWIFNLVYKLLSGDRGVASLLRHDPFPDAPPTYVRASLYRYEFTHFGEQGWWHRTRLGTYLPPLRRDDPRLLDALDRLGWAPER
ncbi:MAG TPA: lipase maturation factor family protein [Polyangiaceae bacterium]|nr:lipase maturation factor family protein [Polyangiaceae bacterium]